MGQGLTPKHRLLTGEVSLSANYLFPESQWASDPIFSSCKEHLSTQWKQNVLASTPQSAASGGWQAGCAGD